MIVPPAVFGHELAGVVAEVQRPDVRILVSRGASGSRGGGQLRALREMVFNCGAEQENLCEDYAFPQRRVLESHRCSGAHRGKEPAAAEAQTDLPRCGVLSSRWRVWCKASKIRNSRKASNVLDWCRADRFDVRGAAKKSRLRRDGRRPSRAAFGVRPGGWTQSDEWLTSAMAHYPGVTKVREATKGAFPRSGIEATGSPEVWKRGAPGAQGWPR